MKIFLGGSRWQQNQPITPPNEKACFFFSKKAQPEPNQGNFLRYFSVGAVGSWRLLLLTFFTWKLKKNNQMTLLQ